MGTILYVYNMCGGWKFPEECLTTVQLKVILLEAINFSIWCRDNQDFKNCNINADISKICLIEAIDLFLGVLQDNEFTLSKDQSHVIGKRKRKQQQVFSERELIIVFFSCLALKIKLLDDICDWSYMMPSLYFCEKGMKIQMAEFVHAELNILYVCNYNLYKYRGTIEIFADTNERIHTIRFINQLKIINHGIQLYTYPPDERIDIIRNSSDGTF